MKKNIVREYPKLTLATIGAFVAILIPVLTLLEVPIPIFAWKQDLEKLKTENTACVEKLKENDKRIEKKVDLTGQRLEGKILQDQYFSLQREKWRMEDNYPYGVLKPGVPEDVKNDYRKITADLADLTKLRDMAIEELKRLTRGE